LPIADAKALVHDLVIAVDAMGGDHAPGAVVAGAMQAARRGLAVTLAGPAELLYEEIAKQGGEAGWPSRSPMHQIPSAWTRRRSPRCGASRARRYAWRRGSCARRSGGVLQRGPHGRDVSAPAHAAFGMLPGVDRPALAVSVPTETGAAILLDAGANLECRPEHLAQFGVMGAAYARVMLGIERPKVGLLSIGEEAGKGTELVREAHGKLALAPIEFIGNLEAREFFTGRRRRHRVRRFHGQHRVEGRRRLGRGRAAHAARGARRRAGARRSARC
jgi:glycerol-3-phosphate acyltransferase PlsX